MPVGSSSWVTWQSSGCRRRASSVWCRLKNGYILSPWAKCSGVWKPTEKDCDTSSSTAPHSSSSPSVSLSGDVIREKPCPCSPKSLLRFLPPILFFCVSKDTYSRWDPFVASSGASLVGFVFSMVSESCYSTILDYMLSFHCKRKSFCVSVCCSFFGSSSPGLCVGCLLFPYLFRNNNRAPTSQLPKISHQLQEWIHSVWMIMMVVLVGGSSNIAIVIFSLLRSSFRPTLCCPAVFCLEVADWLVGWLYVPGTSR